MGNAIQVDMCKVVILVIGVKVNCDTLKVTPVMSLYHIYKEQFNDLHPFAQYSFNIDIGKTYIF